MSCFEPAHQSPGRNSILRKDINLDPLFSKDGKDFVNIFDSLTADQVAELKELLLPQVEDFITEAAAGNYKGPPNFSMPPPPATGDAYEPPMGGAPAMSQPPLLKALIIGGSTGSGKTTASPLVAKLLEEKLGYTWIRIEQDFFKIGFQAANPNVFHGLLELLHLFGINVVIARMSLNDMHIHRIVKIYGSSNVTVVRPDETHFIAGVLGQRSRHGKSQLWQVIAAHAQKRGGMRQAPLSVHTIIIKLATVDCGPLVKDVQNILSKIKVIGDWHLDLSPETPPDQIEKWCSQIDWTPFTKTRKPPEEIAKNIVYLYTSGAH